MMGNSCFHLKCDLYNVVVDRELLQDHSMLEVPAVVPELSSRQVLTTEFIEGIPLDRCTELDQETRDQVCYSYNALPSDD